MGNHRGHCARIPASTLQVRASTTHTFTVLDTPFQPRGRSRGRIFLAMSVLRRCAALKFNLDGNVPSPEFRMQVFPNISDNSIHGQSR